jgi:hypothetical protein
MMVKNIVPDRRAQMKHSPPFTIDSKYQSFNGEPQASEFGTDPQSPSACR